LELGVLGDRAGVTAKCGCAPGVDGRVLRPAMTVFLLLSLPGEDPAIHLAAGVHVSPWAPMREDQRNATAIARGFEGL
jgi:hypothetical protein